MTGQPFLPGQLNNTPRRYPTYVFPPPLPPPFLTASAVSHPPCGQAAGMTTLPMQPLVNESPAVIVSPVRQKKKHKKQPSVYSQSDIEAWKLSDAEIIGDFSYYSCVALYLL